MSDTTGLSPENAAAARAADQARIRKERRDAKIKAGGSARLNKITGLAGGIQRDPAPSTTASIAPSPAAIPDLKPDDPDEVDISNAEHLYKPETTNRAPPPDNFDPSNINEDALRQMMLGFDRPAPAAANGAGGPMPPNPLAALMGMGGGASADTEDPMAKILAQMLGCGAAGGMPSPFGQPPPQPAAAAAAVPDAYAAAWRLLHFAVALGMGLAMALLTQFTGTKVARERGAFAHTTGAAAEDEEGATAMRRYFFWAFATAESVLITSRFFLDRGRPPPAGMLHVALGFLPGRWQGLASNGLRYTQIFSTIRADLLVCVFVLGVCSWLRG